MNNRNELIEKANKQYARAMCAGCNKSHLRALNNGERFWTEWCSLEDVEIIGDLSIHAPRARTPITFSFTEYGFETCINCGESAHAYYDKMILKCPHCRREYDVEIDQDGHLIFTFSGEYNREERN